MKRSSDSITTPKTDDTRKKNRVGSRIYLLISKVNKEVVCAFDTINQCSAFLDKIGEELAERMDLTIHNSERSLKDHLIVFIERPLDDTPRVMDILNAEDVDKSFESGLDDMRRDFISGYITEVTFTRGEKLVQSVNKYIKEHEISRFPVVLNRIPDETELLRFQPRGDEDLSSDDTDESDEEDCFDDQDGVEVCEGEDHLPGPHKKCWVSISADLSPGEITHIFGSKESMRSYYETVEDDDTHVIIPFETKRPLDAGELILVVCKKTFDTTEPMRNGYEVLFASSEFANAEKTSENVTAYDEAEYERMEQGNNDDDDDNEEEKEDRVIIVKGAYNEFNDSFYQILVLE